MLRETGKINRDGFIHAGSNGSLLAPSAEYCAELLAKWPAEELLKINLAALAEKNEPLAREIAAVKIITDSVRPVVAADGSVSYRLAGPEGRDHWLGFTSVPMIAARANRERMHIGTGNLAMVRIGSGAEAELILQAMAPYQALFVIEPDPLNLNLAFRLHDFSPFIQHGQLVILLGENLEALLRGFYREHPGYQVVSEVIRWTWISDQENQVISQRVGQALEIVLENLNELVKVQQQEQEKWDANRTRQKLRDIFSPENITSLRITNCTHAYTLSDIISSRDILAGFAQMGVRTDWFVLNHPEKVSVYAQLQHLQKGQYPLLLLVDALRGHIESLPKSSPCLTVLVDRPVGIMSAENNPSARMGPLDFILYPRQDDKKRLLQADIPAEKLIHFPLAVNDELFHPEELDEQEQRRLGADVIFVGDRLSTDPNTYQINLATHQELWQQVIEEIHKSPRNYHYDSAARYLARGESCGVKLTETKLREYFIELIQNALGDAVLRDIYCRKLDRSGIGLRIWSWRKLRSEHKMPPPYWQESPVSHLVAGEIDNSAELNKLYQAGKIFLHISSTGYPDSYLLNGIAAGAFFLVKSHPRDFGVDGISRYLKPMREIITFDSPQDMVRKVKYFLLHEEERRKLARQAREKLLAGHTYRHNCQMVLERIRERLAEGETVAGQI